MYPLLSRGRFALGALLVLLLLYSLFEAPLLRFFVRKTASVSPVLARRAVVRAGQVGPMAASVVVEALHSADPVVRIIGCRLLKRWKSRLAVPMLVYLLVAEQGAVRREAQAALEAMTGRRYHPEEFSRDRQPSTQKLVDALVTGKDFHRRIARSRVARVGLPAVPILVRHLDGLAHGTRPERSAAFLEALAAIGCGYDTAAVTPFLLHRDEASRAGAVKALIALGDAVVPQVVEFLDSKHYWTFMAAVQVVGTLRPEVTAARLADEALSSRTEESRRRNIYHALGQLKAVAGLHALSVGAEFEESPKMRMAAVKALASIPSAEAVKILMRSTHDSDSAVRRVALQALYKHGTPEAHRALANEYLSPHTPREQRRTVDELLRDAGLDEGSSGDDSGAGDDGLDDGDVGDHGLDGGGSGEASNDGMDGDDDGDDGGGREVAAPPRGRGIVVPPRNLGIFVPPRRKPADGDEGAGGS